MARDGHRRTEQGRRQGVIRSWGAAKVEIAALRDEIITRLRSGHTIRKIYLELAGEGRISVSQRQFYAHVTPLRDELARRSQASLEEALQQSDAAKAAQPELHVVAGDAASNPTPSNISVNDDPHTAVSAAVVPLARKSGAGGFTLNRDFNIEE